jgi:hypothetical protein
MMRYTFPLMLLALAVAGCGEKPKPDPNIALCPEATIKVLQANQRFFDAVKVGETPSSSIRKLRGPVRKATLVRAGEPSMRVYFYETNLPRCPWLVNYESLTPVVVRNNVIDGLGAEGVKKYTDKGWVLQEAEWPWQRYHFGYVPQD